MSSVNQKTIALSMQNNARQVSGGARTGVIRSETRLFSLCSPKLCAQVRAHFSQHRGLEDTERGGAPASLRLFRLHRQARSLIVSRVNVLLNPHRFAFLTQTWLTGLAALVLACSVSAQPASTSSKSESVWKHGPPADPGRLNPRRASGRTCPRTSPGAGPPRSPSPGPPPCTCHRR